MAALCARLWLSPPRPVPGSLIGVIGAAGLLGGAVGGSVGGGDVAVAVGFLGGLGVLVGTAGTGVFVGGTGVAVAVGGTGVLVGGTGVLVGDTGVLVGGTAVLVGGTGVLVGGMAVFVGTAVFTTITGTNGVTTTGGAVPTLTVVIWDEPDPPFDVTVATLVTVDWTTASM
jgi:hypothetical protein